jgi:hypothetical protein
MDGKSIGRWGSAWNFQLRDKESTIGMGLRRKLLAHIEESIRRNGILLGITSSWALIQTGKIKMQEKISIVSATP